MSYPHVHSPPAGEPTPKLDLDEMVELFAGVKKKRDNRRVTVTLDGASFVADMVMEGGRIVSAPKRLRNWIGLTLDQARDKAAHYGADLTHPDDHIWYDGSPSPLHSQLVERSSPPPLDFWEITDLWIKAAKERYADFGPDELTQIFMRGPFAGWSEREVLELATRMDEAKTKYPIWK